jgi:hypothetical protein
MAGMQRARRHAVRVLFLFGLAIVLGACRTPEAIVLREKLKASPEWPAIRKAAQVALSKNEPSQSGWTTALLDKDNGAIYPISKNGDAWLVQVCADYPLNRYGWVVEMEITSPGEVRRYSQLWKKDGESKPNR